MNVYDLHYIVLLNQGEFGKPTLCFPIWVESKYVPESTSQITIVASTLDPSSKLKLIYTVVLNYWWMMIHHQHARVCTKVVAGPMFVDMESRSDNGREVQNQERVNREESHQTWKQYQPIALIHCDNVFALLLIGFFIGFCLTEVYITPITLQNPLTLQNRTKDP
jgi:hypothetical protein